MSSGGRVITSALAAVILASVIIGACLYAGYLPASTRPALTGTGSTGNQTTAQPSGSNNRSSGSQGTGSGGTGGQGVTSQQVSEGTLSVLVTDPPQVPEGVTAVYITYDDMAVHSIPSDPYNGWIELNITGTIEASGLVNVSQTVAATQVPTGSYDMVRFNVSSVMVTYDNLTYPASLSTQGFEASFAGGLQVNGSRVSAALVDLQPLVVDVGSSVSPQFVFSMTVDALGIAQSYVTPDIAALGFRMDLGNLSWFQSFCLSTTRSLVIDSANLTNSSLTLTVTNTGNVAQALRFIMVTPALYATSPAHMQPIVTLPDFYVSLVFAIEPNGTLEPVPLANSQTAAASAVTSTLAGSGFNLSAGQSVTITYRGALAIESNSTGSGTGTSGGGTAVPVGGGTTANSYEITVVGDTASASIMVDL